MKAVFRLFLSLVLCAPLALAQATRERFYDEIFDHGKVRPEYRTAYDLLQMMTPEERQAFLKDSLKEFQNDNLLDPMPRIFTAEVYDRVIKAGVEQRAFALREFLKDHYSGKKSYLRAGVIPEDVLTRIIARHYEETFEGKIDPNSISFIYGPDIIRDRKGQFLVIEDNPGWVGGLGDLKLAQEYTFFRFPQLKETADYRDADEFYRTLGQRYNERAARKGGVAVLYMIPPYPDNEDKRIRDHFKEQGIEMVTPFTRLQMKVEKDGVYLFDSKDPSVKRKKIGMVVANGEFYWLDPSYPAHRRILGVKNALAAIDYFESTMALLRELKRELKKEHFDKERINELIGKAPYKLKKISSKNQAVTMSNDIESWIKEDALIITNLKERLKSRDVVGIDVQLRRLGLSRWISTPLRLARQAEGLTEAFLQGKVDFNNTPGIEFIGDKEFYVYVEDLIRFYTRQEPILKNIPTKMFADADGRLRTDLMNRVFRNFPRYVTKPVDGRGGDGISVGPKVKARELPAIQNTIRQDHLRYLVQVFTSLSRLGDNIVDTRLHTDVGPDSIFVTDTPWGRGLPKDGNGKVNISAEGREITTLVLKGKLSCAAALGR